MKIVVSDPHVIKVFLLPGNHPESKGILPKQGRDGDRGFDCFATAISDGQVDPECPYRLKRLWDFKSPPDHSITKNIVETIIEGIQRPVYLLHPGKEIILGLGLNFDMGEDWSARIVPRSSSAGKGVRPCTSFPIPYSAIIPDIYQIGDMYADVPIDGNHTGEPRTVLKNFGNTVFPIFFGRRITQLVFEGPNGCTTPRLEAVDSRADFRVTNRNGDSHGSSGLELPEPFTKQMELAGRAA